MKILVIIGTRPEAIKMAPLVKMLKRTQGIETMLCNTGQHKDLVVPILDFFQLRADVAIDIMTQNQGLHGLTAAVLTGLKPVLESFQPDYVLVHGDTSTSFAASLAAFYCGCKVAHIEAGLRTRNKWAPFPEEMNRRLNSQLSDVHFAPTRSAADNLYKDGITENVFVTGNTVIDALMDAIQLIDENDPELLALKGKLDLTKKIILFTGHRRENFGKGFDTVFSAIDAITENREDVTVVYPVHPNPNVKNAAIKHFTNNDKVILIEALSYGPFAWLMQKSYLILTDSGGIQEEAPSLGKPVLVLREVTERPEAVEAGSVIIVGTDKQKIIHTTKELLDNETAYHKMTSIINPYGDGKACERIVSHLVTLAANR